MTTTFARGAAAVIWGVLFWVASQMLKPLFPDGFDPGLFAEINAFFGALIAWNVVGSRAGSGYVNGISYGITATVLGVIVALFFNCAGVMVVQSMQPGTYAGPVEAVVGVFTEMVEYGMFFLRPEAYRTDALLLGGGAIGGIVVEFLARRTS